MNKFIKPLILLLLSAGLFFSYSDPTYKDIKKIKKTKIKYDEALGKSKELRIARDNLVNKYNSFSENDLTRIRKMLPDNVDNVRLIMDINSIAAKYGAFIRNVKVNTSEDEEKMKIINKKKYDSVVLEFSISATYEDFLKFIFDLKNSLRLVDIIKLDFSSISDTENYKYNFTIKTYRLI